MTDAEAGIEALVRQHTERHAGGGDSMSGTEFLKEYSTLSATDRVVLAIRLEALGYLTMDAVETVRRGRSQMPLPYWFGTKTDDDIIESLEGLGWAREAQEL